MQRVAFSPEIPAAAPQGGARAPVPAAVYADLPHKHPTLQGYLDAYSFHRRLCEAALQGQSAETLPDLLPDFGGQNNLYRESFKSFVFNETLPEIRRLFYDIGRSKREAREVLDALLLKVRGPDRRLSERWDRVLGI